MNSSLRIGSLFGITIRVHVLLLVLIALVLIQTDQVLMAAALVAMLASIVVLHELGHSIVARSFGIHVLDITLWPLGGMARMSQIPESPKIEGLIAVAGPIVNFVLAALAGIVLGVGLASEHELGAVAELAQYMVGINLLMGLFNLIPAFPMDGGRILRAFLGRSGNWVSATEAAVKVGRVFAGLIAVVGVVEVLLWPGMGGQGVILLLVAAFVWFTGAQEVLAVKLRHGVADIDPLREFAQRAAADWSSRTGGGGEMRPDVREDGEGARGFSAEEVERLEKFRGPLRGYRMDDG